MVGLDEVIFDRQYAAYVKEELACKTTTVFRYELFWWSIVEDPLVYEKSGYLRRGDTLHWYSLSQFCEPIRDNQEVFVTTWRPDELTQDVNAYLR